jgi:cytochrome c biogenesis protein
MAFSTTGVEVRVRSQRVREAVELISSMRFAISLLTLICIAAVIGTVVQQNQPATNYVNQFGPFWADVFAAVNLFTVYSAPWFLLILGFLVVSTSLCIARNAPKILADLRQFRENLREQSLAAFHHRGQGVVGEPREAALERVARVLAAHGWVAKAQIREGGTMVAARKGRANKLGYLAAHSAIVLVCVGGLLDGDLIVRAQMALQGKSAFDGSGLVSEVPDKHRLSMSNPTYRGNLFVPEGARSGMAVLTMPSGVVLQPLPFDVELKRFIVEYYATGMPKLFASEIVVHDRASGRTVEHRVEVNKPAFHDGIAIYQSSFEDGGSRVKLRARPLAGGRDFEVEGRIGEKTELVSNGPQGEERVTLEFAALRVINVENLGERSAGAPGTGGPGGGDGADVRKVDLVSAIDSRLGAGTKVQTQRELRNVGPSITYRIRDAAGQAREYHNYMAPMELDGSSVFLAGVRENTADAFRYLRIPADADGTLDSWLLLKKALADPALREQAAQRYARIAAPGDKPDVAEQLVVTTRRALGLFAGAEAARPAAASPDAAASGKPVPVGGLQALSDFMEAAVPEAERMRVSGVLVRILNGALFELANLAREQAGLAPLKPDAASERFMALAVTSLSDSFFYPAPVLFQLTDFTQVQASVFQVARAPGKTLVYAGAVLLIVGVFMMLYVRDRRLWVWLQPLPDDAARTRLTTALSSTRRTLDGDAEFERLRAALLAAPAAPAQTPEAMR